MKNTVEFSLARISLRWMVQECFRTNTGIRFHARLLKKIGLVEGAPTDSHTLSSSSSGDSRERTIVDKKQDEQTTHTLDGIAPYGYHQDEVYTEVSLIVDEQQKDAMSGIHDELAGKWAWAWWIIEFFNK